MELGLMGKGPYILVLMNIFKPFILIELEINPPKNLLSKS